MSGTRCPSGVSCLRMCSSPLAVGGDIIHSVRRDGLFVLLCPIQLRSVRTNASVCNKGGLAVRQSDATRWSCSPTPETAAFRDADEEWVSGHVHATPAGLQHRIVGQTGRSCRHGQCAGGGGDGDRLPPDVFSSSDSPGQEPHAPGGFRAVLSCCDESRAARHRVGGRRPWYAGPAGYRPSRSRDSGPGRCRCGDRGGRDLAQRYGLSTVAVPDPYLDRRDVELVAAINQN